MPMITASLVGSMYLHRAGSQLLSQLHHLVLLMHRCQSGCSAGHPSPCGEYEQHPCAASEPLPLPCRRQIWSVNVPDTSGMRNPRSPCERQVCCSARRHSTTKALALTLHVYALGAMPFSYQIISSLKATKQLDFRLWAL